MHSCSKDDAATGKDGGWFFSLQRPHTHKAHARTHTCIHSTCVLYVKYVNYNIANYTQVVIFFYFSGFYNGEINSVQM